MDRTTKNEGVTPTMLATTVAIALWGRHAVLLSGRTEAGPAKELGKTMMRTVKTTERGRIVAGDVPPGSGRGRLQHEGRLVVARTGDAIIGGTPTGDIGVAERAHHGVLTTDDVQHWEEREVVLLYVTASQGRATSAKGQKKERLCDCQVIGSITGCRCSNTGLRCECDQDARDGAARSFWNGVAYFLFEPRQQNLWVSFGSGRSPSA